MARIAATNAAFAEASWEGHLTLDFSNSSGADCRIYAEEGICQLLFLEGEPCETTYADRSGGGKYQNQSEEVTLAKV
jgi:dCTP deaminase